MERGTSNAPRAGGTPVAGIAISVAVALLVGAAALAIEPLRDAVGDALRGDTEALRSELTGNASGVAILVGLILVHTFVWYPAEIVDAAAGLLYDFWFAFALVQTGWVVQGLIAYGIGREAARPLLHRFIGLERFERAERAIERGGTTLLLAARLVPIVPFSLFSYAAGAAHVPIGRFAWTTAVGYAPLTALFVYFGTRLETLSLSDPIVWIGAVILLALLFFIHHLRSVFVRETPEATASDQPPG